MDKIKDTPELRTTVVDAMGGDLTSHEDNIHSLAGSLYYMHVKDGPLFQALPSVDQGYFESVIRMALQVVAHYRVPVRRPVSAEAIGTARVIATGLHRPDKVVGFISPKGAA